MKHTRKHTCTCVCTHAHATIEEKNEFEREQWESAWEDLEDGREWEEMVSLSQKIEEGFLQKEQKKETPPLNKAKSVHDLEEYFLGMK